ncbi:MAG: methyltransferase domain-containing protein [Chloroflexi bacterium CFX1]|nr:methyltransferase domain-containing protein [Chloroflexi bacterium CFX1]MDL1919941.1 class I SAM-dependent methyltransferase [Chloroflexi bacterium CFX5]NUQ58986.1 methyltransferase domain-containing protein [Anaerolineales bacterium]
MENIDELKRRASGEPRYKLSGANVFVSPGGFHYIDHLDAVEAVSPEIDGSGLTEAEIAYIETSLQSNPERLTNQIAAVKRNIAIGGMKALDIGCGGGLFLAALKREGAHVTGIELSDTRAHYAKSKHGIEVVKRPIEDEYWGTFANSFDIVTLWDVIEHVNFPQATLKAAARTLKPGGVLLIDTPCRDAFYHRFGELTYRLSRGRYPTFLNAMYSAKPFGHKQILSLAEMRGLLEEAGLQVIELKRFHELSFPYAFYLKKLVRSESLVKILLPFVRLFFVVFPIRNKMLAAGRKK